MHIYIKKTMLFPVLILFLTGCMYPKDELAKNKVPNEVQLQTVQEAIHQYAEDHEGRLPIVTKSSDTPIFQKYVIDFQLLKDTNYLYETPGNAFENGGVYQYVLIHPETNPMVKLIDLRNVDVVRKVNVQLHNYRSKHLYPPFGEEVSYGVYTIDYKRLGFRQQPYVVSPYSGKNLPLVMDAQGKIYIDYRIDLYQALNEFDHS